MISVPLLSWRGSSPPPEGVVVVVVVARHWLGEVSSRYVPPQDDPENPFPVKTR